MRYSTQSKFKGLNANLKFVYLTYLKSAVSCHGVYESVKAASQEVYGEKCRVIASSETISDSEFKKLQEKKAKTKIEWYQEPKALLKEHYGVEVTR